MVVIVLGSPRSGSSMTSGIIHKMGINMGTRFVGSGPENPVGFYEDKDFLVLNRKILAEAGGRWDRPPAYPRVADAGKVLSDQIDSLLKKKNKNKMWGWKEPRTVLTLPLYLKRLNHKDVRFVFIHRNLLSSGISLAARPKHNLTVDRGMRLALQYETQCLEYTRLYPEIQRIHVAYEKMLKDPKVVNEIGKFLGVKVTKAAKNHINPSLERSG